MANQHAVALSVDALGPRLTGIGRYSLELVQRLPDKLGAQNLSYFRGEQWLDDPRDLLAEDWRPVARSRMRRRYEGWQRGRKLRNAVVHAPNYFLPVWAERGVATIHDLSVLLYPETHPIERIKAFEKGFERTLLQARTLVTDSETVRQELVAMFGVAPERIKAVTLGIPKVSEEIDCAPLREIGLEPTGYVLCVSTFEPRKRIDRLVEAYCQLPLSVRQRYPLVLVGGAGWRNDALNSTIEAASRDGTVRRLGFVSEATLEALYAGARLFIYPSRYEGFGLPVVEAMAHGIPCIIADSACLIEVARGAALIVDPEDPIGFSDAISTVLESEVWLRQAALAGKAVAGTYSWDECVNRMVDIYRTVPD